MMEPEIIIMIGMGTRYIFQTLREKIVVNVIMIPKDVRDTIVTRITMVRTRALIHGGIIMTPKGEKYTTITKGRIIIMILMGAKCITTIDQLTA